MRSARSVPSFAAEELLNFFLHCALDGWRRIRAPFERYTAIAAAEKEAPAGAQVSRPAGLTLRL